MILAAGWTFPLVRRYLGDSGTKLHAKKSRARGRMQIWTIRIQSLARKPTRAKRQQPAVLKKECYWNGMGNVKYAYFEVLEMLGQFEVL